MIGEIGISLHRRQELIAASDAHQVVEGDLGVVGQDQFDQAFLANARALDRHGQRRAAIGKGFDEEIGSVWNDGLDILKFARDDEVLAVFVLLQHLEARAEHVPALDHRGQVLLVDLPLLRAAYAVLFPTFVEEDDGGNAVDAKRLVDLG